MILECPILEQSKILSKTFCNVNSVQSCQSAVDNFGTSKIKNAMQLFVTGNRFEHASRIPWKILRIHLSPIQIY